MSSIIRTYRARRIVRTIISALAVVLVDFTRDVHVTNSVVASRVSATLFHQSTDSTSTSSRRHIQMTKDRQLEEMSLDDEDDTFLYNDLSTYSIRYEKCQFVKMYDDELASNQEGLSSSSSPLATKHFVIYRLCRSDTCSAGSSSSSSACGTDPNIPYGTYTMTVEEYLYYTINYQKQVLEQSCNFCDAYCVSTSSSSSSSPYCTTDCTNSLCQSCSSTCDEYQTFTTAIANGATNIADAANYIQCQKLELQNENDADDNVNNEEQQDVVDDDTAVQYYIGPYCQSIHTTSTDTAKTSISIGLFSDENCYSPITDMNMN